MLKRVLKATVRGSGQSSHARLIYGLAGTKEKSASARGAQIVTQRTPRPPVPQARFHLAAGGEPAMTTYLNWGPCQVPWRGVVVFGGGVVGSVDARPYLGPRPVGR
jgi:hypothetical protein